jgi:predicted RNA-binding Zn-ribbon protein involved in translation (DUF1610 family)
VKPHPRIRKTVKWGGAVVSVLVVVLWVGSGWWTVGYVSPSGDWVEVSVGSLGICHGFHTPGATAPSPGWFVHREKPLLLWFFGWYSQPHWALWFFVPLWVPAAATLLATAAAWRLDALARRRAKAGHCPKCGYDLRGLREGAVCPECGAAAAQTRPIDGVKA